MNSGIARTPAERAAFAALNAHRLDEAQARFAALLEKEPDNGRVAAGMGFLRMQQKNFGGAISYLTQAEQNGYKVRSRRKRAGHFALLVHDGRGHAGLRRKSVRLAAQAKYRAALAMNPRSPEALNGLAGLLTKEQQYAAAAERLRAVDQGSAGESGRLARSLSRLCARQPEPEGACRLPPAFRPA